jgi:maltoporin
MKKLILFLGLAVASTGWADDDFTFNAYYRTGVAFSEGGTEGVCYNGPGWPQANPRLGNECVSYIEYFLKKQYKPSDDPDAPWFRGSLTTAMTLDGNNTVEDTDSMQLANREAYVEAVNFVWPGAVAWAGKRFYKRLYVEMWDFFLLENQGLGFGVYDVPLGSTKLALAMFRNHGQEESQPYHTNGDIRWSGLPLGDDHSLELLYIYGQYSANNRTTGDAQWRDLKGQQFSAIVSSQLTENVKNKLFVQYGLGIYGARPESWPGMGAGSTLNRFDASAIPETGETAEQTASYDEVAESWKDSSTLQVTTHVQWDLSAHNWFLDMAATLTEADFGGRTAPDGTVIPDRQTLSFGLRPAYMFTDHHSMEMDLYLSRIKNGLPLTDFDGSSDMSKPIDRDLNKLTLAYIFRPAMSYFAKPQLRLYGTYGTWNDAQKGDSMINGGSQVYADQTHGYTIGVQGEVWW